MSSKAKRRLLIWHKDTTNLFLAVKTLSSVERFALALFIPNKPEFYFFNVILDDKKLKNHKQFLTNLVKI